MIANSSSLNYVMWDGILLHYYPGGWGIAFRACKPGHVAYEVLCNGHAYGLYTKCLLDVTGKYPQVTNKEIVSLVNMQMAKYLGIEQQSVLICPLKRLDEVYPFSGGYARRSENDDLKTEISLSWLLGLDGEFITTPEGQKAFAYPKGTVAQLDKKIRVVVRSREHAPPHFHIESPNIDAAFRIDSCERLEGRISSKDMEIVRYWFFQCDGREKLVCEWDKMRPGNCPAGKF